MPKRSKVLTFLLSVFEFMNIESFFELVFNFISFHSNIFNLYYPLLTLGKDWLRKHFLIHKMMQKQYFCSEKYRYADLEPR